MLEPNDRTPADRFEDFLQSRGMRNTNQRRVLLKVAFQQDGYFDADQLIDQLPSKGATDYVSRPTVYRTLSEFVDAGILRKFELDGRAIYEPETGMDQHDHFYCTDCKKLMELKSSALIELTRQIAQDHQFQIHSYRLVIRGQCVQCRHQRRRKKRRVDLI